MIRGTGVDIVSFQRMADILGRSGSAFLRRTFTEGELLFLSAHRDPTALCAALFAGKEAVFKTFGSGWERGGSFRDIEIDRLEGGLPHVALRGIFAEMMKEDGSLSLTVRLSSCATAALAMAIRG